MTASPTTPATSLKVLSTFDEVRKFAEGGAVVAPAVDGATTPGRVCRSAPQALAALRWAMDAAGGAGALVKSQAGEWGTLGPELAEQVDALVPTSGPERALIAFVGHTPSEVDAARGAPLCGLDGRLFDEAYLAPLGLTRADVLLTNLVPQAGALGPDATARFVGYAKAELSAWRPRLVVALGKAAHTELGKLAHFVLPHPGAVRRSGDSGELARKLKRLAEQVAKAKAAASTREVHIAKAVTEERVVVGVALDPYQFDSQDDWCPAREVRNTAWGWLENSRVVGFMHEVEANATVLESALWPYPTPRDYHAAMANQPHRAYLSDLGTDKVHSGAWVVSVRVDDPVVWESIKAGEITGYSIGGYGIRTEVDRETAIPEVEFIEQRAPADADDAGAGAEPTAATDPAAAA